MQLIESIAVVFAVAYLVLAVRQNIWCWPAAIVSVILSFVVFYDARLVMEAALQVFYLAMGVYGWRQWRQGGADGDGVDVHWWPLRLHALSVVLIVILTLAFGRMLIGTDAAWPYLDSFTTVGAIVTTWMVTRKIIENWIYWFVIDGVSIYVYLERGLYFYAALFAVYLVLVVIGFIQWHADSRAAPARA